MTSPNPSPSTACSLVFCMSPCCSLNTGLAPLHFNLLSVPSEIDSNVPFLGDTLLSISCLSPHAIASESDSLKLSAESWHWSCGPPLTGSKVSMPGGTWVPGDGGDPCTAYRDPHIPVEVDGTTVDSSCGQGPTLACGHVWVEGQCWVLMSGCALSVFSHPLPFPPPPSSFLPSLFLPSLSLSLSSLFLPLPSPPSLSPLSLPPPYPPLSVWQV